MLHSINIFPNIDQNVGDKILFKLIGPENLIPTIDSDLHMEMSFGNYIFKDEKVNFRFSRKLFNIIFILPASNAFTEYDSPTKLFRRSFN